MYNGITTELFIKNCSSTFSPDRHYEFDGQNN
jgi:hypothetical protein